MDDGLIPAHAGKTWERTEPLEKEEAHPRSRGENYDATRASCGLRGSSPLTRGKHHQEAQRADQDRLIPAHAGKTHTRRPFRHHPGAHPRSRGENAAYVGDVPNDTGSSPLTRGKPPVHGLDGAQEGLIPAHAGKTSRKTTRRSGRRAHPRSRGENGSTWDVDLSSPGSSPLTRGKLIDVLVSQTRSGLIPAHAGKTCRGRSWLRRPRAHPRSRGENRRRSSSLTTLPGSSPLTRGKLKCGQCFNSGGGLIPAHAGKTGWMLTVCLRPRAHPRSRGENLTRLTAIENVTGSSPLTRGKHDRRTYPELAKGLIPAHAGKT